MALFGKYLKEQQTEQGQIFYWYPLSAMEIILAFMVFMLIVYLVGFFMSWSEIWGLQILPLSTAVVIGMFAFIAIVLVHLLINRKAMLLIEGDQITFQKRPLTGKCKTFTRSEINGIGNKLESQFYESDTGYYPDIYRIYIYLTGDRKVKLGGFNEEDAQRIIGQLRS